MYKAQLLVDGQWSENAMRFETKEEAEGHAKDIFSRWTQPTDWRVVQIRKAIIRGGLGSTDKEGIENYLPRNYKVFMGDDGLFIEGYDDHGWTLDGYIIPRLASGLICAEEVKS